MHDIYVLCYPSHITHVFQGLDVICFGLLKCIFDDERRKYEQQGYRRLKKEHFLKVYAAAHTHTLTEDVVKAAFARTGVVSYNPQAIQTAVFKPSIETSAIGTGTPVPDTLIPPTPIRLVQHMIQDASCRSSCDVSLASTCFPTPHASEIPTPDSGPHLQHPTMDEQVESLTESLKALQTTSVGFLFSEEPVASTSEIPKAQPSSILPPLPDYIKKLLSTPAKTEVEQQYHDALLEMFQCEAKLEGFISGLQASNLLQGAYLEQVCS